ncbi:unnamed protein product [Gongylonema pulchrum]|uniref:EGF-like domain-containing protein n=1 Tax=Gongylonema pulchrum TaxID=637853 RepID=A0A183DSB5_9BILA|nr:unnamed protein product [Gongylonema pulchrum]
MTAAVIFCIFLIHYAALAKLSLGTNTATINSVSLNYNNITSSRYHVYTIHNKSNNSVNSSRDNRNNTWLIRIYFGGYEANDERSSANMLRIKQNKKKFFRIYFIPFHNFSDKDILKYCNSKGNNSSKKRTFECSWSLLISDDINSSSILESSSPDKNDKKKSIHIHFKMILSENNSSNNILETSHEGSSSNDNEGDLFCIHFYYPFDDSNKIDNNISNISENVAQYDRRNATIFISIRFRRKCSERSSADNNTQNNIIVVLPSNDSFYKMYGTYSIIFSDRHRSNNGRSNNVEKKKFPIHYSLVFPCYNGSNIIESQNKVYDSSREKIFIEWGSECDASNSNKIFEPSKEENRGKKERVWIELYFVDTSKNTASLETNEIDNSDEEKLMCIHSNIPFKVISDDSTILDSHKENSNEKKYFWISWNTKLNDHKNGIEIQENNANKRNSDARGRRIYFKLKLPHAKNSTGENGYSGKSSDDDRKSIHFSLNFPLCYNCSSLFNE